MEDIYSLVAAAVAGIPDDVVTFAADKIGQTKIQRLDASTWQMSWGEAIARRGEMKNLLAELISAQKTPAEVAGILHAACAMKAKMSATARSVEVLWTGPQTSAVPVRQTEQALCELIESAREELFIVSFVAYKASVIYDAIKNAIKRGVDVSFLLEASEENGGTLKTDPLAMLKGLFPTATFYKWNGGVDGANYVVHAKCAIADSDLALVTSANLTNAAMSGNMELGLLVKDKDVCEKLSRHFKALAAEDTIRRC